MAASSSPILFIRQDIQSPFGLPSTIQPLVCFTSDRPTEPWYEYSHDDMFRMNNTLLISVFFPEGIDGRKAWNRCVITYDEPVAAYTQTGRTVPNVLLLSGSAEKPNVKMGWMHHFDAMFFKKNVLRGEARERAEEKHYAKWKSF